MGEELTVQIPCKSTIIEKGSQVKTCEPLLSVAPLVGSRSNRFGKISKSSEDKKYNSYSSIMSLSLKAGKYTMQ